MGCEEPIEAGNCFTFNHAVPGSTNQYCAEFCEPEFDYPITEAQFDTYLSGASAPFESCYFSETDDPTDVVCGDLIELDYNPSAPSVLPYG